MIPTRSVSESVKRSVERLGLATHITESHERTDGLTESLGVQMRDTAGESNARESDCDHEWMEFGGPGDEWRECFLCGRIEDQ